MQIAAKLWNYRRQMHFNVNAPEQKKTEQTIMGQVHIQDGIDFYACLIWGIWLDGFNLDLFVLSGCNCLMKKSQV